MEHIANSKQLEVAAKTEELDHIIDFIDSFLIENGFDQKSIAQTSIAAEEIFTNICLYAYPAGNGTVKISVCMESLEQAVIRFADNGTAFDPLSAKEPDTTLSTDDRREGGLGIFMMQQLVSYVDYSYEDGMNVLTIIKQKTTEAESDGD